MGEGIMADWVTWMGWVIPVEMVPGEFLMNEKSLSERWRLGRRIFRRSITWSRWLLPLHQGRFGGWVAGALCPLVFTFPSFPRFVSILGVAGVGGRIR